MEIWRFNKVAALLMSFILSAIVHEYIICVGMVCGVAYCENVLIIVEVS